MQFDSFIAFDTEMKESLRGWLHRVLRIEGVSGWDQFKLYYGNTFVSDRDQDCGFEVARVKAGAELNL